MSFSSVFDSVTTKLKSLNKTPLEKKVWEATSNDNWGVANSVLIELSRETFDYNNCSVIMKEVWTGISEKREKWRRIYKSLSLLEYCLKYGAERVVSEAKSEVPRLRSLEDFKHMEEGRDKGPGIREKSKYLADLLGNAELLKAERAKAQESKERYAGVSSAGTLAVPSGYATSGPATNRGGSASLSFENTTNKLEEYREKERLRMATSGTQKPDDLVSHRSVTTNPPVTSQSGRIVVNTSGLISLSSGGKRSGRVSSESSSSSSDAKPASANLIDFDAPVVVKPKTTSSAPPPGICSPGYPGAPNYGQTPAPYAQPQAPIVQAPYIQTAPYGQTPSYGQTPYIQTQVTNPYSQTPYPQAQGTNPYSQTPYGQAQGTNPYSQTPYGQTLYPQAQGTNPYSQTPYGQAQGTNPYGANGQTNGQSNPFAAFNGL